MLWPKQLKESRACFEFQFEGTACQGQEGIVQEHEAGGHLVSSVGKLTAANACTQFAHLFLFRLRPVQGRMPPKSRAGLPTSVNLIEKFLSRYAQSFILVLELVRLTISVNHYTLLSVHKLRCSKCVILSFTVHTHCALFMYWYSKNI